MFESICVHTSGCLNLFVYSLQDVWFYICKLFRMFESILCAHFRMFVSVNVHSSGWRWWKSLAVSAIRTYSHCLGGSGTEKKIIFQNVNSHFDFLPMFSLFFPLFPSFSPPSFVIPRCFFPLFKIPDFPTHYVPYLVVYIPLYFGTKTKGTVLWISGYKFTEKM